MTDIDWKQEALDKAFRFQGSAWLECGRMFAPYYRQAHLKAYDSIQGRGREALLFAYEDIRASFTEYLEKYNEMYNNPDTARRIHEKQTKLFSLIEKNKELIDEYKKTNNYEFLKAAVDLQVNEIANEVQNLRILKHEIMEMITQDTGTIFPLNTLFQSPVSISKLDYASGEQQRVISFTV